MSFQWGAGEIQSRRRKKSGVVTGSSIFELGGDGYATDDDDPAAEDEDRESYGEFGTGEFYGGSGGDYGASSDSGRSGVDGRVNGRYCSMDLASMQSPTDSGLAPSPLARSMNSMPSLRKTLLHHGSSTSIIIRETSIQHLDEQDQYQQQEFQFQTFVNSRGWQGIRDSMYFIKAGVEAIIEDQVSSRFKAKRQLASWNMLSRTSVSFYHFLRHLRPGHLWPGHLRLGHLRPQPNLTFAARLLRPDICVPDICGPFLKAMSKPLENKNNYICLIIDDEFGGSRKSRAANVRFWLEPQNPTKNWAANVLKWPLRNGPQVSGTQMSEPQMSGTQKWAKQLASCNMLTQTSVSFYHFLIAH
ncbi:hypothetical protein niasHT_015064 [Heterodera trifolii]|uniref:Uncharacterized protein n=1 Tax=Heterodera trifolii TaxID=157864 RepID=A0ABD2L9X1_9BILA